MGGSLSTVSGNPGKDNKNGHNFSFNIELEANSKIVSFFKSTSLEDISKSIESILYFPTTSEYILIFEVDKNFKSPLTKNFAALNTLFLETFDKMYKLLIVSTFMNLKTNDNRIMLFKNNKFPICIEYCNSISEQSPYYDFILTKEGFSSRNTCGFVSDKGGIFNDLKDFSTIVCLEDNFLNVNNKTADNLKYFVIYDGTEINRNLNNLIKHMDTVLKRKNVCTIYQLSFLDEHDLKYIVKYAIHLSKFYEQTFSKTSSTFVINGNLDDNIVSFNSKTLFLGNNDKEKTNFILDSSNFQILPVSFVFGVKIKDGFATSYDFACEIFDKFEILTFQTVVDFNIVFMTIELENIKLIFSIINSLETFGNKKIIIQCFDILDGKSIDKITKRMKHLKINDITYFHNLKRNGELNIGNDDKTFTISLNSDDSSLKKNHLIITNSGEIYSRQKLPTPSTPPFIGYEMEFTKNLKYISIPKLNINDDSDKDKLYLFVDNLASNRTLWFMECLLHLKFKNIILLTTAHFEANKISEKLEIMDLKLIKGLAIYSVNKKISISIDANNNTLLISFDKLKYVLSIINMEGVELVESADLILYTRPLKSHKIDDTTVSSDFNEVNYLNNSKNIEIEAKKFFPSLKNTFFVLNSKEIEKASFVKRPGVFFNNVVISLLRQTNYKKFSNYYQLLKTFYLENPNENSLIVIFNCSYFQKQIISKDNQTNETYVEFDINNEKILFLIIHPKQVQINSDEFIKISNITAKITAVDIVLSQKQFEHGKVQLLGQKSSILPEIYNLPLSKHILDVNCDDPFGSSDFKSFLLGRTDLIESPIQSLYFNESPTVFLFKGTYSQISLFISSLNKNVFSGRQFFLIVNMTESFSLFSLGNACKNLLENNGVVCNMHDIMKFNYCVLSSSLITKVDNVFTFGNIANIIITQIQQDFVPDDDSNIYVSLEGLGEIKTERKLNVGSSFINLNPPLEGSLKRLAISERENPLKFSGPVEIYTSIITFVIINKMVTDEMILIGDAIQKGVVRNVVILINQESEAISTPQFGISSFSNYNIICHKNFYIKGENRSGYHYIRMELDGYYMKFGISTGIQSFNKNNLIVMQIDFLVVKQNGTIKLSPGIQVLLNERTAVVENFVQAINVNKNNHASLFTYLNKSGNKQIAFIREIPPNLQKLNCASVSVKELCTAPQIKSKMALCFFVNWDSKKGERPPIFEFCIEIYRIYKNHEHNIAGVFAKIDNIIIPTKPIEFVCGEHKYSTKEFRYKNNWLVYPVLEKNNKDTSVTSFKIGDNFLIETEKEVNLYDDNKSYPTKESPTLTASLVFTTDYKYGNMTITSSLKIY